jgi:hypothetical protein
MRGKSEEKVGLIRSVLETAFRVVTQSVTKYAGLNGQRRHKPVILFNNITHAGKKLRSLFWLDSLEQSKKQQMTIPSAVLRDNWSCTWGFSDDDDVGGFGVVGGLCHRVARGCGLIQRGEGIGCCTRYGGKNIPLALSLGDRQRGHDCGRRRMTGSCLVLQVARRSAERPKGRLSFDPRKDFSITCAASEFTHSAVHKPTVKSLRSTHALKDRENPRNKAVMSLVYINFLYFFLQYYEQRSINL